MTASHLTGLQDVEAGAPAHTSASDLIVVWEDTVALRPLLIGLVCGSALGISCYLGALRLIAIAMAGESGALAKAYALMGGVGGSLIAAVLVGLLVKPKRIFDEAAEGAADRLALLRDYGVDPDEEREALAQASPRLLREMRQVQIHDLLQDHAAGAR